MFKRKIYNKLLEWKQASNGKTALLIEGARRIGKSTVVECFAKEEYKSYILIDFSKASKEVKELFDDISDLDYIFLRLQLIYKTDLHLRESVIIFDEVQLCPVFSVATPSSSAAERVNILKVEPGVYIPSIRRLR